MQYHSIFLFAIQIQHPSIYILDTPLTFETRKKKLKIYYLHGKDSEEVKTMLENCKK